MEAEHRKDVVRPGYDAVSMHYDKWSGGETKHSAWLGELGALEDQLPLLRRIAGWLRPGGLFVATTGYWAWTGYEENWLDGGVPM